MGGSGQGKACPYMFDNVEAFYRPDNLREAVQLLHSGKGQARLVAGGTDLVTEDDQSVRILIDITRAGLSYVRRRAGTFLTSADRGHEIGVHSHFDGGDIVDAERMDIRPAVRTDAGR